MPIYGKRAEDTLLGPDGRPLTGVSLELYPTEADATARTNAYEAVAVSLGRWLSSDLPDGEVWAREPGGRVYQLTYPTSQEYVDAAVAAVRTDMAAKADAGAVNAALAGKADATATQAALDGKADRADMLGRLSGKADKSTVDLQLATKASTTDLQNAVAGLATLAQVNAKADAVATQQALSLRATHDDVAAAEARAKAAADPKGTAAAQAAQARAQAENTAAAQLATHGKAADPHPREYVRGELVTNLIGNPTFLTNRVGWSAGYMALSDVPASDGVNRRLVATMVVPPPSGTPYVISGQLPLDPVVRLASFSGRLRSTFASNGPIRVEIRYFTAGGASLGTSRTITVPADGVLRDFRIDGDVPPTTAERFCVIAYAGGTLAGYKVGETLELELPTVTATKVAVEPFAGNSPGAWWAGTAHGSTSAQRVPRPSTLAFLTESAAQKAVRHYEGTGSPEGVVAAPVGSRYIDTAATNGALEWRKWSGTGTTGWRPTTADTGWRDVRALLDTTAWDTNPNIANTFAHLRRIGSEVFYNFQIPVAAARVGTPRNSGANPILPQQDGFKVPLNYTQYGIGDVYAVGMGPIAMSTSSRLDFTAQFLTGNWGAGNTVRTSTRWVTNDAWPTSLPGTAA